MISTDLQVFHSPADATRGARTVALNYTPYDHQLLIHDGLSKHRFFVANVARQQGKTWAAVASLCTAALAKPGTKYAYVAPTLVMAKQIAWALFRHQLDPIPQVEYRDSELKITLLNGSTIQLFSGEKHDAIRGQNFHGMVCDEIAMFPREAWGGSIRPTLQAHRGWCLFISTPRGHDLFYELYNRGADPDYDDWGSITITIDDTPLYDDKEKVAIRRDALVVSEYAREQLCSFEALVDNTLNAPGDVRACMKRTVSSIALAAATACAVVIGVDPAGEGKDTTVAVVRQGDAVLDIVELNNTDPMFVVGRLQQLINKHTDKPRNMGVDAVFVDSTGGYGSGIISRMQQLGFDDIYGVNFSSSALDQDAYANRRAEMWVLLSRWLKSGHATLPQDNELIRQLTAVQYKFDSKNRIQLERKDELKRRIGRSPDTADALALTFSMDVEKKTHDPDQRRLEEHVLRREMLSNSYGGGSYDPFN